MQNRRRDLASGIQEGERIVEMRLQPREMARLQTEAGGPPDSDASSNPVLLAYRHQLKLEGAGYSETEHV